MKPKEGFVICPVCDGQGFKTIWTCGDGCCSESRWCICCDGDEVIPEKRVITESEFETFEDEWDRPYWS